MNRRFSSDIIEHVITSSDIVDIISQYVTLTKTGTSLKCCCPFHNEKTPSFVVSPDKQLYHCFGCGAGGNVINFIKDIEKLNFVEALKYLADRANISLPQNDQYHDQLDTRRQQLESIHRDAAIYFYKQLINDLNAQQYLFKRGIQHQTIKKFGLGYAPDQGNGLLSYLLKKQYQLDIIAESGLIVKSNKSNDYYDRFRGRIIFPIQTVTSKVVGFGGRVLDSQKFPKYLNSPETKIFIKGKQLYGLNYAKKNINNDQIVLVEGYMDVISLCQKGMGNVVATLGTALTRDQGLLLKRYAKEIIIAYDGDDAGQKAAEKAVEILRKCDLNVKILLFPKLLDPDDYIKTYGLEGFNDRKKSALSAIEYKIVKLKEKYNTSTMDGRISFVQDIAAYLATIDNEIELEATMNTITKEMEISKQALRNEISKKKKDQNKKNTNGKYRNEKKSSIHNAYKIAQANILRLFIKDNQYYYKNKTNIQTDYFSEGIYRILAEYIIKNLENNEMIEPSTFLATIQNEKDVKIASLIFTSHEDELEEQDISSYLNTLKRFKLRNELLALQEQMINTKINEEKNEIYYQIIDKKKQLESL
ncbi:MAG: DNA primase [Eubacteriales bacterium]